MHENHSNLPAAVSVRETARMLSIGHTKTYELIGSGVLRSIRIGRRRLILRESIDAVLSGSGDQAN
jgi:excisionase family DNA binding protein